MEMFPTTAQHVLSTSTERKSVLASHSGLHLSPDFIEDPSQTEGAGDMGEGISSSFNFCASSLEVQLFATNYPLSKQFTQVLTFSWDESGLEYAKTQQSMLHSRVEVTESTFPAI